MKREDYYEQRSPSVAQYGEEVKLPVTKGQFEDLLKDMAAQAGLCDVDDDMRQVLAGWVHHIPNTQATIKVSELKAVLHKSVSNNLTWLIDQEIKLKRLKEAKDAADKMKDSDNVLNMPPRPIPGMDASS